MAADSEPKNVIGNINNNQGIITQGQQGNNTIINERKRLEFSEDVGLKLVAKLVEKIPLTVIVVGSETDFKIGNQFADFLIKNGYEVVVGHTSIISPTPDAKISIQRLQERYAVIIAPSAN